MSNFFDYIIVGAGASGISAANYLANHQKKVKILEARSKIGGRVYSDQTLFSCPIDLGGHWLHSADKNPLLNLAYQLNLDIDCSNPNWGAMHAKNILNPVELATCLQTMEEFHQLASNKNLVAEKDESLASALPQKSRWENIIRAAITFQGGARAEEISRYDWAAYEETEQNWRIMTGMGNLFERLAKELDISLNTPVHAIDFRKKEIKITTRSGDLFAKKVLVTASTNVLAKEVMTFSPSLPVSIQNAFSQLPLGNNTKVIFSINESFLADISDTFIYSRIDSEDICSFQIRPHGKNIIVAFFGGDLAKNLDKKGDKAYLSYVRDEFKSLLGNNLSLNFTKYHVTKWSQDPWILGSYSYAKVHSKEDRKILQQDIDEKVYFAGEATSLEYYSTCHGAYLSGRNAAKRMLAS